MRLPNFLIIGAMKAGTTTLYRDLLTNPRVFFPLDKEPANAPLPTDESQANESQTQQPVQWNQNARVLLVEDNFINQQVAVKMIEKFGGTTDIAQNGREALEKLVTSAYDLVFMDCQMPEMDGYEATRIIREKELNSGAHIPIIAMTANAMQGDREKCIDAGMDDYLAKPLRPEMLQTALVKWTNAVPPGQTEDRQPHEIIEVAAGEETDHNHSAVLDAVTLSRLRELASEDPSFLADLFAHYLIDTPGRIQTLRKAVQVVDRETIKQTSHALKGASRYIGAVQIAQTCQELEIVSQTDALANARELTLELDREFTRVKEEVESMSLVGSGE